MGCAENTRPAIDAGDGGSSVYGCQGHGAAGATDLAGRWKTFLRNHAAGIASIDLFVVRTISFKLLYGRVIVGHLRRKLIRVSVITNPTAEWIAAQVTEACPWNQAPRPLTRDCDRSFGPPYTHRIRAMGICDRPPRRARRGRSDVERTHRLNSSGMPRSYSGVWGGGLAPRPENLRLVLQSGPHSSILESKNTPLFRRSQTVGDIAAIPILGGLPHLYVPV